MSQNAVCVNNNLTRKPTVVSIKLHVTSSKVRLDGSSKATKTRETDKSTGVLTHVPICLAWLKSHACQTGTIEY
jgi:hypothetical protein